jgi:hypothetical protein
VRTTITLADDVAAAVERLRRERSLGVSEAVNELIRNGLVRDRRPRRFAQRTHDLGPERIDPEAALSAGPLSTSSKPGRAAGRAGLQLVDERPRAVGLATRRQDDDAPRRLETPPRAAGGPSTAAEALGLVTWPYAFLA